MLCIQAVSLILNVSCNLVELVRVRAGVVSAEQQFAHGHDNTYIGLRSTPVAPIGGG